ncbi:MAG: acyl-CoA dehydratase activase-related protein [Synergistales bacterium]|nr:acyl-CoA dehydratase activase-related protein [Synergistales bacterium]
MGIQIHLGIDIGTAAIHCIGVSPDRNIVIAPAPVLHHGDPLGCLTALLEVLPRQHPDCTIIDTSFTGSGSALLPQVFPEILHAPEPLSLPRGILALAGGECYLLHSGAKDTFFLHVADREGRPLLVDWGTNSKCGGGSGTLLEKQIRRLFETPALAGRAQSESRQWFLQGRADEQLFGQATEAAQNHEGESGYNARCGVVIQSDVIHDQNEGATKGSIMAKLFDTVAANMCNDVIGNRTLKQDVPLFASGGLFAFPAIRRGLADKTGREARCPQYFHSLAALGIALMARDRNHAALLPLDELWRVTEAAKRERRYAPSLRTALPKVHTYDTERAEQPVPTCSGDPEVVIGVDGGSTTTKAAVIDYRTGRLLDSCYYKTSGDPLGALQRILETFSSSADMWSVKGICTTGSARKLYERVLLSNRRRQEIEQKGMSSLDCAVDEITCHARGIKHWDNDIDTIFEIGGQDMKFTSFRRVAGNASDEVAEARMNYSCQAGAGQTLENMAGFLGFDVEDSLQEAALRAERVPLIDATCGVFMEMEEQRLIAENFSRDEIAAAIVRATAASYFDKFVGGPQHVQQRCSAQGGPTLGKAFLAALAQVTGTDIHAYPHRELFGAYGAALWLRQAIEEAERQGREVRSAFRGWATKDMEFHQESITCREFFGERSCGQRNCELTVFTIGDEQVVSGGFCPLGNSESGRQDEKTDYVEIYHRLLERHFDGITCGELEGAAPEGPTIGIRRSSVTVGELAVWSSALFRKLGFLPVLSPITDGRISSLGSSKASTDFCIAMKIAAGHAAYLAGREEIDYIFTPSLIDVKDEARGEPERTYCIFTKAESFIVEDMADIDRNRLIRPVWHLGEPEQVARELQDELKRHGHTPSLRAVREAMDYADERMRGFHDTLAKVGDSFLHKLEESDSYGYVGLGRDYVLTDPEASSNTGRMFARTRGMEYIPQIFLEHRYREVPVDDLVENEYWIQSARITQAAIYTASHPRLFPIRLMNFACGPDSIKFSMESEIFNRAGKPFLHLMTDAQSNNAPFVTRAEAHQRVVAQQAHSYGEQPLEAFNFKRRALTDKKKGRTWLIPYMGHGSTFGTAVLRHHGIDASVLPTNTTAAREIASRLIPMETCFPLKGVIGDILAYLEGESERKGKERVNKEYTVFLPTTNGPCRFGKYVEILGFLMDQLGYGEIPIASPSTQNGYLESQIVDVPVSFSARAGIAFQEAQALHAADLYDELLLRYRPYAADREAFAASAEKRRGALINLIEQKGARFGAIKEWARETAQIFRDRCTEPDRRFPLVLYIGEIYMRQHDPYTASVIEELERQGLEMIRGPVTEWIRYITWLATRDSRRLLLTIADRYVRHLAARYQRLYDSLGLQRPSLPHPKDVTELLEREDRYHTAITGESPLSIGHFLEFMEGNIGGKKTPPVCGVFHVGPFTCMQEGAATARIEGLLQQARRNHPTMLVPVVHAFFGDTPNSNLYAEIAAFREQCALKHCELQGAGTPQEVRSHP